MKRFLTSMMICAAIDAAALPAAAANTAPAKDIPVTSEVRDVTVYSDSAQVTRVAEVDIPAGAHNVVFTGLPLTLAPDSLRVEATAGADLALGAIVSKKETPAAPVPVVDTAKQKEVNARIAALEDQVSLIEAEKEALDSRKTFLSTLGQQATAQTKAAIAQYDLKPDQWTNASQAVYTGMAEVLKASVQDDIKLRGLQDQIAAAKAEVVERLPEAQPPSWTAEVPLDAKAATHATISLSYRVSNAGWKPLYDARLDGRGKGSLTLTQYGDVQQTTGEDWNGVSLTLSTTQPQRLTAPQQLAPMWVDAFKPSSGGISPAALAIDSVTTFDGGGTAMTFRSMSSNIATAKPPSAQDQAEAYNKRAASFVTAQANTTKFTSEYKVPGPASVPADGTDTKLMVGNFDAETRIGVEVVPQQSTNAYIVAHAKLKGDAPTLGGNVDLFRDNAFIGESTLPMLRPGEETALYFGIDDAVSVTRSKLKDEQDVAGVLNQTTVLERRFLTKIQNLHKSPVELTVTEAVPAPRDAKVTVDISPDTTAGYAKDVDHDQGKNQWAFTLQPEEAKEITLGWKVSWPSDETLSGVPNM